MGGVELALLKPTDTGRNCNKAMSLRLHLSVSCPQHLVYINAPCEGTLHSCKPTALTNRPPGNSESGKLDMYFDMKVCWSQNLTQHTPRVTHTTEAKGNQTCAQAQKLGWKGYRCGSGFSSSPTAGNVRSREYLSRHIRSLKIKDP